MSPSAKHWKPPSTEKVFCPWVRRPAQKAEELLSQTEWMANMAAIRSKYSAVIRTPIGSPGRTALIEALLWETISGRSWNFQNQKGVRESPCFPGNDEVNHQNYGNQRDKMDRKRQQHGPKQDNILLRKHQTLIIIIEETVIHSVELLKLSEDQDLVSITALFNRIYTTRNIPMEWLESIVVKIPKKPNEKKCYEYWRSVWWVTFWKCS